MNLKKKKTTVYIHCRGTMGWAITRLLHAKSLCLIVLRQSHLLDWPQTSYVAKAGLEYLILLPPPLKC